MLLIPVVLVIGGILALVIWKKDLHPIESKAYSDRGQRMPRCMKKPLPLK
jgi:hypothetical protein